MRVLQTALGSMVHMHFGSWDRVSVHAAAVSVAAHTAVWLALHQGAWISFNRASQAGCAGMFESPGGSQSPRVPLDLGRSWEEACFAHCSRVLEKQNLREQDLCAGMLDVQYLIEALLCWAKWAAACSPSTLLICSPEPHTHYRELHVCRRCLFLKNNKLNSFSLLCVV